MADIVRTELDEKYKKMLLDIDPKKINVIDINKLFGTTYNIKTKEQTEPIIPRYKKITLKANEYINKTDVVTTPGTLLFNKLLVEANDLSDIIPNGYYNPKDIGKKGYFGFLNLLFPAVVAEKIDMDKVIKVSNDLQFWGLKLIITFSPSFTKAVATSNPKVIAEKKKCVAELRKKYGDDIPLSEIVDLEDKLVEMNRELIKDDPGMTLYKSGSRGSFENDFKNCNVMVGAMQNPATGKYDLMESNYIDGIEKKDLPIAGNIVVNAGYPKAVGTKDGGYFTKKFYAAFQSIVIDEKGTDCKTKVTLDEFVTDKNKNNLLYSYILEGDKLVLLTPDNINKYVGKTVHKRSPLFCKNKKICNKCAGELFNYFNLYNAGATAVTIPNGLMNKNMKRFHVAKVFLDEVDLNTLIR